MSSWRSHYTSYRHFTNLLFLVKTTADQSHLARVFKLHRGKARLLRLHPAVPLLHRVRLVQAQHVARCHQAAQLNRYLPAQAGARVLRLLEALQFHVHLNRAAPPLRCRVLRPPFQSGNKAPLLDLPHQFFPIREAQRALRLPGRLSPIQGLHSQGHSHRQANRFLPRVVRVPQLLPRGVLRVLPAPL